MAGLPALPNYMCEVNKPLIDNQIVINDTGAALALGDYAVFAGKYHGIATTAMEIGATTGSIDTREGLEFSTTNIKTDDDFLYGSDVFWDATEKRFENTSAVGLFLIGYVNEPKDADNKISVIKERFTRVVV